MTRYEIRRHFEVYEIRDTRTGKVVACGSDLRRTRALVALANRPRTQIEDIAKAIRERGKT